MEHPTIKIIKISSFGGIGRRLVSAANLLLEISAGALVGCGFVYVSRQPNYKENRQIASYVEKLHNVLLSAVMDGQYYNLWSTDNDRTDANDEVVIKSVYDPSPVGYSLPASNAFTGFTTTGQQVGNWTIPVTSEQVNAKFPFDKGWYFYTKPRKTGNTSFFYASGFRNHNSGRFNDLSSVGGCWVAGPYHAEFGHSLYLGARSIVHPINYFYNSFGWSVRSAEEKDELVANCDRFESLKHSIKLPYAFTEQGVAMLSSVLHTKTAVQVSIKIMEAFVEMRHSMLSNASILQHLTQVDRKLLENDEKFKLLFAKFEESKPYKQGIFFQGQTYDAYSFVCYCIRKAKQRIVLIDNYVDDTVLTMLNKRTDGVEATIYTMQISKSFELDIEKHNSQYPAIDIKVFRNAHDRFLVIDDKVYHFGASIKDLGKKWFAVSKLTEYSANELLSRL